MAAVKPEDDFSLFDERLHQGGRFASAGRRAGSHAQAAADAPLRARSDTVSTTFARSPDGKDGGGGIGGGSRVHRAPRLFGQLPAPRSYLAAVRARAWLLAAKMWDDECYENPEFASLFGHDVDDLNALEQRFVAALGYRLGVSPAEYARYYFALRSICQEQTEAFPLRPLDAELEAGSSGGRTPCAAARSADGPIGCSRPT